MAKEQEGRWSDVINLANVAVHVHLLPNGKVLHWGRRQNPKSTAPESYDEHKTLAFVWDPVTNKTIPTANEPLGQDGKQVNLFCAGHAFLGDGSLFIAGGHWKDGHGIDQACIYDHVSNKFYPKPVMNNGRWYPSVLTMPDGRAFVSSGSFNVNYEVDNIPQIWNPETNTWTEGINSINQLGLVGGKVIPLYPRMHLSPQGRVIVVGPLSETWWFDLKDPSNPQVDIKSAVITPPGKTVTGRWTNANLERRAMFRDYAPSVNYDTGKIMYIGGGLSGDDATAPTNDVEYLDLNAQKVQWTSSAATNMKFPRRQFNATVLPDGSVFVTGGSKGAGFNAFWDPVRASELWNPSTKAWTKMAAEKFSRCYHGVALLLPDGRVLSAGSGEYQGCGPEENHTEAQIWEPPYLFKGGAPRPTITSCPSEIQYAELNGNKPFNVTLSSANTDIGKISWIRLGSVTHCRNMNQSYTTLSYTQNTATPTTLSVLPPKNANISPPGHYMLFVLDKRGVPSISKIVRVSKTGTPAKSPIPTTNPVPRTLHLSAAPPASTKTKSIQPTLSEHASLLASSQNRPPIVIGISPSCPYGLGPCWGGAYDALTRLSNIEVVSPVPSQSDALAYVYLNREKDTPALPDLDIWKREFNDIVNASYEMRGVEVTLRGVAVVNTPNASNGNGNGDPSRDRLVLRLKDGVDSKEQVVLGPFDTVSQLKWDIVTRKNKVVTEEEKAAYGKLLEAVNEGETEVQVTGTLRKDTCSGTFMVDVREFEVVLGLAN